MKLIHTPQEMQTTALSLKGMGKSIGFVPTMGYLHDGHLTLLRKARQENDIVVLSIYVNPTQFAPNEDLEKYPQDREGDLQKATLCETDIVFLPTTENIYPAGYESFVSLENLPNHLCGKSRPGHFRGVATIVLKLLNSVQPDRAYFGQKDYQQLAIVKKMTADLNLPIEIIGMPIVREADGLAMSSRNNYLNVEERNAALSLSQSLQLAQSLVKNGEKNIQTIKNSVESHILSTLLPKIEYIELCHPHTLEPLLELKLPALLAIAAVVGKARLIDNCLLR